MASTIVIRSPLALAIGTTPSLDLGQISQMLEKSLEETAQAVNKFLIHSFGLRFFRPIAEKLLEAPNGYKTSIGAVYGRTYQHLSALQKSLAKGLSPEDVPEIEVYRSMRISDSRRPTELIERDVKLLLSTLPNPPRDIVSYPRVEPAPYLGLEERHLGYTQDLYGILSNHADPTESSTELLQFVTRCDGIKGISWLALLKEWGRDEATDFLKTHPLYELFKDFDTSYSLPLPDPSHPADCTFQEFVCLRTLDLVECALGFTLPKDAQDLLLDFFRENEAARLRLTYVITDVDAFLNGPLENDLLRTLRIVYNLSKNIPRYHRSGEAFEQIISWIFTRDRSIRDVQGLDRDDYEHVSSAFLPVTLFEYVSSLQHLYPETFDAYAFYLLIHLRLIPNYDCAFHTFKEWGLSPHMRIDLDQLIHFCQGIRVAYFFSDENERFQQASLQLKDLQISPSTHFFDFITCPDANLKRVSALMEVIHPHRKEQIDGDHLFTAMIAACQASPEDLAFAKKMTEETAKYDLTASQKLHLHTTYLKMAPAERAKMGRLLDFMKELDLFIGHPLPPHNAYALLLFHPDMAERETLTHHIQRLTGLRLQLDRCHKNPMIPARLTQDIRHILGKVVSEPPAGLLPNIHESTYREVLGTTAGFEIVKGTVIEILSQLNFAMFGVFIGPADVDHEETSFFKAFFPKCVTPLDIVPSTQHASYVSLEDAPTSLPHTFLYGHWKVEKGRPVFCGSIIYEKTGKTCSLEVPLNLPTDFLAKEGEPFFTLLGQLYLDVCSEHYVRQDHPYEDQTITTLDELLVFYKEAEQAWGAYHPEAGSKLEIAPPILQFLFSLKRKTRAALRHLAMEDYSPADKKSLCEVAAQSCLYPHPKLPHCSLLPPTVPLKLHTGYTLSAEEDPTVLHRIACDAPREFVSVGKLCVTEGELPLGLRAEKDDTSIQVTLEAPTKESAVQLSVRYPLDSFEPHHLGWHLLMLKGEWYRASLRETSRDHRSRSLQPFQLQKRPLERSARSCSSLGKTEAGCRASSSTPVVGCLQTTGGVLIDSPHKE